MKVRLVKSVATAFLLFGAVFCVFSLLSWERILLAVPLAALAVFVTFHKGVRSHVQRTGEWMDGHLTAVFAVAIGLSLIGRVVILHWIGDGDPGRFNMMHTDSRIFWAYAREMAGGGTPPVKSWTTAWAYAGVVACFGERIMAVVGLNFICQLATAACLHVTGKIAFSKRAGIVASVLYLVSPSILLVTMRTLSENFYFMFLAAALMCFALWFRNCRSRWLLLCAMATWLCTWSRGEGVLLVGAVPLTMVLMLLSDSGAWKGISRALLVYLLGVCMGAGVGLAVNASVYGTRMVFCSADNYWPRLIGARIETDGHLPVDRSLPDDKKVICRQYLADHPGDPDGVVRNMRPQTCPAELIPYIRRETSRRWQAMSFPETVKFVLTKELYDWSNSYRGKGRLTLPYPVRTRIFGFAHVAVLVFACLAFARSAAVAFARPAVDRRLLLSLTPFVFLCGVICLLAIFEANIRYGLVACVLLPFYAAGGAFAQPSRE